MERREKKNVKNNWILKIIVVAIFLVAAIIVIKISGNYRNDDIIGKINLVINNSNVTSDLKQDIFIDENDVIANHSALIGTFSTDEIFYLMSRGISKKESENLLTKGFLLKGITYYKDTLKEIINRYWR